MNLKGVKLEDFVNYKKPSMFLITCFCDWKCCWEIGVDSSICQNMPIAKEEIRDIPNEVLYNLYERSEISKSIVLGGLEPFLQFPELCCGFLLQCSGLYYLRSLRQWKWKHLPKRRFL